MSDIQKADPVARRRAVFVVVIGTIVGAALILDLESYRPALQEWILSEPDKFSVRLNLVFLVAACVVSAPALGFGAYIWLLGARVTRAQQYPPPAQPVIRDTLVVRGRAALLRGIMLKALAVCLITTALLLPVAFWRLAVMLSERAA